MTDHKQPDEWLRNIAQKRRGRVVSINLYDSNVCTNGFDWHDALDNSLSPPPDRFRYKLKLNHNGRSFTIRSNDRFVAVEVLGEYAIESPFSINRQDRVCFMNIATQIEIMGQRRDVFVCKGRPITRILEQSDFWSLIDGLNLNSAESIHVYRNGLTIYIQPDSEKRIEEVITAASNISDQLPPDNKSRSDLSDLPQEFIHLIPFMRRWAEADDEQRTDRLARASQASLRNLVDQVAPLFAQINSYLDGFRDAALPESALALDALAQCAAEAQLLLERKNK
jgi:hypothetical protein